jgi:hypothetical protein
MMSLSGINPASLIIFLAKSMILTGCPYQICRSRPLPIRFSTNWQASGMVMKYLNIRMRNRYGSAISYLFAKQRHQNHWTLKHYETGSNEFCGFYAILFDFFLIAGIDIFLG